MISYLIDFNLFSLREEEETGSGPFVVILKKGEPEIHDLFDDRSHAYDAFRDLAVEMHWEYIREIKRELEEASGHIYPDWDDAIESFMKEDSPYLDDVEMRELDLQNMNDLKMLSRYVANIVRGGLDYRINSLYSSLSKYNIPDEIMGKISRIQKTSRLFKR